MAKGKRNDGIFTALGAATGLGNALRFPSLCALYGGAFVIAYALCLAFVCYPLMCAELYLGKRYAQSFDKALGQCAPKLRWLAYCAAANCAIIALYYAVISAKLGGAFAHFAAVGSAGDTKGFALFTLGALSVAAVWFILRGAPARLARTGKAAVISSLGLFAALFVAVLARGGNALALFDFEFSDFARGSLWADALGQSLLALSLAGGVMPTFARSFDGDFSLTGTALKIIAANLTGSMLAAVATLGFCLPVPEGGGVIVALELYPRVIAAAFQSAAAFRIFATLFFAALWLVSIQSACSLFSPAISLFKEDKQNRAIGCVCLLALAAFPLFAANGGAAMLAVDRMACSVNAVVIAFFEAVIFVAPDCLRPLKLECGSFVSALLRCFCPVACGALALFSACAARFSCFPPYAAACATAALVLVFAPPSVKLIRFLRDGINRLNAIKSHNNL